jgi:glutamine cyclotransferase
LKPVRSLIITLIFSCFFYSCKDSKPAESVSADSLLLKYSVLTVLPHHDKAFTEGLVIYESKILESTGLNNQSWIAEVNPGSGEHDKKIVLGSEYFGEGITVLNKKIYQLTYKEKTGFIYDATTYEKLGEFSYNTEGWGITHDAQNLIMSAGTDKLYFLDTTSLQIAKTLTVTQGNAKITNLNELEYANGDIYANVYETAMIFKINPSNGKVIGRLDLSNIVNEVKQMYPESLDLNGIAYDKNSGALLITGKFWPKAYLIKVY